jgi:hypothetical protein
MTLYPSDEYASVFKNSITLFSWLIRYKGFNTDGVFSFLISFNGGTFFLIIKKIVKKFVISVVDPD